MICIIDNDRFNNNNTYVYNVGLQPSLNTMPWLTLWSDWTAFEAAVLAPNMLACDIDSGAIIDSFVAEQLPNKTLEREKLMECELEMWNQQKKRPVTIFIYIIIIIIIVL